MSQKKLPRFASEEAEAEFRDRERNVEWAGTGRLWPHSTFRGGPPGRP